MKKSKSLLALGVALALLGSTAALAEPVSFKKADANCDGIVDSDELAKSGVKKKLAQLDVNKDGKLSKAEYEIVFEEECE